MSMLFPRLSRTQSAASRCIKTIAPAASFLVPSILVCKQGSTRLLTCPGEILFDQFKSCTSGRAGGLICEPLKAVWPAYAGIVTRIFLVDRASYLLSLVPLCT